MDRGGIEELSRGHEISRSVHLAIERYQDCDKNQLKSSIDKLGVKEVSSLLKNSFSRREKHRYECNQACNTTKDPNNILNSQNHLSTKNFKHIDPKNTHTHTHTHTHTISLTNFYISKTSQDSLVSIH